MDIHVVRAGETVSSVAARYGVPAGILAGVNGIAPDAPLGCPVIVALAPKTSAAQRGLLYEAHDYALLGAAANAVFLMTYEWGYAYGPPMAVAPLGQVRAVLDYALTAVAPEKIFMGIPLYGYDWPLPFVSGETRAESLSPVQAVERALRHDIAIQYDAAAQAP